MKYVSLFLAFGVLSYVQPADAKTIKTLVKDPRGTTFVVMVDWDTKTVTARLRANPAQLTGDALEVSLQNAVYYGSAVNCRMLHSGRKIVGTNNTTGILYCPWFDKPILQQS